MCAQCCGVRNARTKEKDMTIRTLLMAGAVALTAATPALAATWDRIEAVNVTRGSDHVSTSPDFGGPIERLRLTARDSSVSCGGVAAVFGNGQREKLWSGRIAQGASKNIDLPGKQRNIQRLILNCHSTERNGRIVVEADAGRYRAQWLRNPTWQRMWANVVDQAVNYWTPIGQVTFTGPTDRANTFTGFTGKSITTVALRPKGNDARCSRAVVVFGNGTRSTLDVNHGDLLRQGQSYRLDLPGGDRNVTQVILTCRAAGGHSVTMEILGRK
jgi:hypothetical protein